MSARANIAGQRYGRLVVLHKGGNAGAETRWWATCDCGSPPLLVKTKFLRSGGTRSCGCLLREAEAKRRASSRDVGERFWEKVDRSAGLDGCWPFMGARDDHGYGRFRIGSKADDTGRTILAHRFAYELVVGPLPEGMGACHRCDNPPCCNAERHLFPGTHADNMHDMLLKGRHWSARRNVT